MNANARTHTPRIVVALLAVAVLATAAGAALPSAVRAAGDTYSIQKIKKTDSLAVLQAETAKVRKQMTQLNAQMATAQQQYDAARAKLAQLSAQLTKSRLELARNQAATVAQAAVVAKRAKDMYKSGDSTFLEVILTSSDLADLQTGVTLYRSIMKEDQQAEARLQQLADVTRSITKDLSTDRRKAAVVQTEIDNQRAVLAQNLQEREAIMKALAERIKKVLSMGGLPAALAAAKKGGYTQIAWANALLLALRMPVTTDNVAAITAWEMAEGGHWYNTAYYNPLNTTQSMPGATVFNSVGVKAYTSWAQGLVATVKTLHNGLYNGILAALKQGHDAQAVANAVISSPWGTHTISVH